VNRLVLLAGLVCLASIATPVARQAARQLPQFRGGVDLVHLDVSVLDRNRRPVRGLGPFDFTVLEDGVPQQVAVFTAVEIPPPVPPAAVWMREVAPDVRSNEGIEERRLFLLIIDDAMIQADVGGMRNTREIGRTVIDRMGPSDLAAVVFTRDNHNSQDFTADRRRLLAAVEKFTVGFRDMSSVAGDDLFWIYSASVIQRAVEMLSALPDYRKSMIYIGQGMPVDLDAVAQPAAPGLPPSGVSALSRQGLMEQIRGLMAQSFRQARRANVNVYTIDVCGLRVEKPPLPITPNGLPPQPPTCQPGLEVDYLHTLAENTNARAIVNTNEFDTGVQAIFDENASYYLLGYQPTVPWQDGKVRRLEVRVNRPGVEVRTRSGYEPEKPQDVARRKAELAKAPLGAALAGILPKSDVALQATAVPLALPGRRESAVAIVVGIRQPIRAGGAPTTEKVDFQVSAFNTDGRRFGSKRLLAEVTLRGGATGLAEYEVLSRLDLRPGRYQLRIAAHIGSLSTSGSLYYDVDVPDVSSAPVSLSPLALSATPGRIAAPPDALADLLPVVPTTRRVFAAGDRVTAFTRVHQGGRSAVQPVALRIRLQDQHGRTAMDRAQDLPAGSFTRARSVDVQLDVPVATLAPGAHLLTVEASLVDAATSEPPAPASRDVRFTVR
jgi:VWFA-related protein